VDGFLWMPSRFGLFARCIPPLGSSTNLIEELFPLFFFFLSSGATHPFSSGHAHGIVPNLWGYSRPSPPPHLPLPPPWPTASRPLPPETPRLVREFPFHSPPISTIFLFGQDENGVTADYEFFQASSPYPAKFFCCFLFRHEGIALLPFPW